MENRVATSKLLRTTSGTSRAHWIAVIGLLVSSVIATVLSLILTQIFDTIDFFIVATTLGVAFVIIGVSVWLGKTLIDETERRIKEQMEVAKLESELEMTQYARELHHDLVNHLSAVSSWIQLGSGDRAVSYIQQILTNVYPNRAHEISGDSYGLTLLLGMIGQKLTLAEEQGVSLDLKLDSQWSKVGIEDEVAVRVLGNLIDNAIEAASKYEGLVRGRVDITTAIDGTTALFRVWNNGPPMPKEIQDRFNQPLSPPNRNKQRGLGLFIVKKLIHETGATLSVQSHTDTGTEVLIRFPYEPAPLDQTSSS